jgi:hypothetical protein
MMRADHANDVQRQQELPSDSLTEKVSLQDVGLPGSRPLQWVTID